MPLFVVELVPLLVPSTDSRQLRVVLPLSVVLNEKVGVVNLVKLLSRGAPMLTLGAVMSGAAAALMVIVILPFTAKLLLENAPIIFVDGKVSLFPDALRFHLMLIS